VALVFSTKNRRTFLLDAEFRMRTHAYLGGILNGMGCQSIVVGGVEDHVHLLVKQSRTETIAKLVGTVKARSSSWIKESGGPKDFEWQAGYGAFSVGVREVEIERAYIQNQEEHHKTVSFQDEYRAFLKEHGIEVNEDFLWD
jgi:REP element-mobilizing transposase RayT